MKQFIADPRYGTDIGEIKTIMKIKAYFPQTFTLTKDDIFFLTRQINEKFDRPLDAEVTDEDLLIEADAQGLIEMPSSNDFKT